MSTQRPKAELAAIAETIFEQLGGKRRLSMMTGAKNFMFGTATQEENKGQPMARCELGEGAKNDIRLLLVYYKPGTDLYDVEFWRRPQINEQPKTWTEQVTACRVSRHEDAYAEDLVPMFERETGFYLSFSPAARP